MRFFYAARKADNRTARIHIPIGAAQTGKGRHYVYAVRIGNRFGQAVDFGSRRNKFKLVAQPFYRRAAHKNTALQSVLHFVVYAERNGGEQFVF